MYIFVENLLERTCDIKKDTTSIRFFSFAFTNVISIKFWLCLQNRQYSAKVTDLILSRSILDGLICWRDPFHLRGRAEIDNKLINQNSFLIPFVKSSLSMEYWNIDCFLVFYAVSAIAQPCIEDRIQILNW